MDPNQTTDASGGVSCDLYACLAYIDRKAYQPETLADEIALRSIRYAISGLILQSAEAAALASQPTAPTPDAENLTGFAPYTPITIGSSTVRPAPTPDAESDLVRRDDVIAICKGIADTSVDYIFSGAEPEHDRRREAMEATATNIRHAVANLPAAVPSASPPPGEDLAGQGEPVAWAYEAWSTFDEHWFPIIAVEKPALHPHRRNIRPLYAAPAPSRPADRAESAEAELAGLRAGYDILKRHNRRLAGIADPAPSRPADREEIARIIAKEVFRSGVPNGALGDAIGAASDAILALRDAPRDAGDGWRQIETAPKDGTPMWAYLYDSGICRVRYWSAQQIAEVEGGDPDQYQPGFYDLNDSSDEWMPKWWLPIDRLPAPPSA